MAVEFSVPHSRTSEIWIAPEDITIDPELNGRHDLPDIKWLVESMLLPHGQIAPVSIRKTEGKPVLVSGFSRYRAVMEINQRCLTPKPLRLKCSYTQLTQQQAFIANIDENRVRNATTPMDDAYNIQKLINVFQMSHEEAAKVYRVSVSWVHSTLKLLEASPEVEKAVRSGRVKSTAVKELMKLSKDAQKKVLAKEGKITAKDVAAELPEKPAAFDLTTLRNAIKALLADCDQQPDVMVYEVPKELIVALRAAVGGR